MEKKKKKLKKLVVFKLLENSKASMFVSVRIQGSSPNLAFIINLNST